MNRPRQFASDNYSGICPEALDALLQANHGHTYSYGDDPWTNEAADLIREIFETKCEVFFVFNGTAANSLAISALCRSYHSVLCHETSHIETDECGAPEFFSNGTKVLLLPGKEGKIDPDGIDFMVKRRTDIHYPKPRVVSVTQATELGTVYSIDELKTIGGRCKKYGLKLHMDGARFANAVATLGVAPKQITWEVGVDVLCFGCTKNGMPVGEAVVFFDTKLAEEFDFRCKQAGQLASKMRFLSAPLAGLLKSGAWLKNAKHANNMARLLESKLQTIPGLQIMFPCQANSVFIRLPEEIFKAMHDRGWHFYSFIGQGGSRLMCSWDTTEQDVEDFVTDLKDLWNQYSQKK